MRVRRLGLAFLAALLVAGSPAAQSERTARPKPAEATVRWNTLPDIPNPVGLAGPFSGTHGDVLIVAGGANFPDGMPWRGGKKAYHAAIYVFDDGHWHTATQQLPVGVAYGVSISTAEGLICIGGQDDGTVYGDVYRLSFDRTNRTIRRTTLPSLPKPLSFAGGGHLTHVGSATLDAIFVVGGQHDPAGSPGNAFYRLDLTRAGQGGFEWETLPPLPGPRRGLPAVTGLAGALYVVSGRDYGPARSGESNPFAYHTDLLRYDPRSSTWDDPVPILVDGKPDQQRCVMASTAIGIDGRMLIFGGASGELLDHGLKLDPAAHDDFRDHHPGFSRDVLAYDPQTGTFAKFGALHSPHRMPVTTTAVRFGDRIVIPTGETSPGKRSPRVWTATISAVETAERGFGFWNWFTLVIYLLGMVAIGVRCSRKISGTEAFFLAGRKIPWWAAGLSIFGTQLSAITFMTIPATTYAGDWVRVIGMITLLVVLPIVIWSYLPVFRRMNLSTAYEYLERRYGPATRTLAAVLFILLQLGRMGFVLFLPSIALAAATGMDVYICIALMGVLAITYTVLGGIEAVIWTDVAQVFVLMGGAVLALGIAIADVGGVGEVLRIGAEADKFRIVHHGYGLDSMTLPVMISGLLILNLIPYTSDQTVIQRYITTSSLGAAQRSLWTNFWITAPTAIIFYGLGTALYAFYLTHPELPTPAKNDEIVPWFIVTQLPAGIAGLAIAAIFAASMSSLDSSMNSVSTVVIFDFYRRWYPDASDARQLRLGRILTLVIGIIGTGTALMMASADIRLIFDAFNKMLGLFGGALAGMFFLGVFCRRTRTVHVLTGTIAGALTVGVLEMINFQSKTPPVHSYLLATFGFAVCAVVGWTFAAFTPSMTDTTRSATPARP